MSNVLNLTPHSVEVLLESQFLNLEKLNPTTWVADGVEGEPVRQYSSSGSLRIKTNTIAAEAIDGVETVYGDLEGLPEGYNGEYMIVSLPAQSMAKQSGHPLASKMLAPYKAVRLRSNPSTVLGCMGFTK
jgi:predicted transcriptional regulator with HTH domain